MDSAYRSDSIDPPCKDVNARLTTVPLKVNFRYHEAWKFKNLLVSVLSSLQENI